MNINTQDKIYDLLNDEVNRVMEELIEKGTDIRDCITMDYDYDNYKIEAVFEIIDEDFDFLVVVINTLSGKYTTQLQ